MVDAQTMFLLLLLVLIYDQCPAAFRERFKWQKPLINALEYGMNKEMDFIQLTRFEIGVFMEQILNPLKDILNKKNEWVLEWLYDGNDLNDDDNNDALIGYDGRKRTLSLENRLMRFLMLCANYKVKGLEILFGQRKSAIYCDAWIIARVICKKWGNKLKLPPIDSDEYAARVGFGCFSDGFEECVYLMDGHEVYYIYILCIYYKWTFCPLYTKNNKYIGSNKKTMHSTKRIL